MEWIPPLFVLACFVRFFVVIDIVIKWYHLIQERRENLPDYFGQVAGVRIPVWAGEVFFFWGLGLLQTTLAVLAFSGLADLDLPIPAGLRLFAACAVVGGGLGDAYHSHFKLQKLFPFDQNPGWRSSWLLWLEGIGLSFFIVPAAWAHPVVGLAGLLSAWFGFKLVVPTLELLGRWGVLEKQNKLHKESKYP